jgi:hypothetical protein
MILDVSYQNVHVPGQPYEFAVDYSQPSFGVHDYTDMVTSFGDFWDTLTNSGFLLSARAAIEFGAPYQGGGVTVTQLASQFGGVLPPKLDAWITTSKPGFSVGSGDMVVLAQVMGDGSMSQLSGASVAYGKMLRVPGISIDPSAGGVAFFTQSADTTATVQWTLPGLSPGQQPGDPGSGVDTKSWFDEHGLSLFSGVGGLLLVAGGLYFAGPTILKSLEGALKKGK